jgi:hypothetical protein
MSGLGLRKPLPLAQVSSNITATLRPICQQVYVGSRLGFIPVLSKRKIAIDCRADFFSLVSLAVCYRLGRVKTYYDFAPF